MSFIIRGVRHGDLNQLMDLTKQFTLLNLPADKKIIGDKIDRSLQSFSGQLPKEKSEYFFVVEDTEEEVVVGSSLIMGKHGDEDVPHTYFKVLERNHVSKDLGTGFIHKVLRFQLDSDGPTEIGGLLVDKLYRKRPEKLGKQISLSRFLYMALFPDRFEDRVLCELTPPFADEGRSEFWEALGRRFTGLPYHEADFLSQNNREFIATLFPEDDIYLCLLDAKARLVLGRVAEATKPAQHLLESIGFRYLNEVDPFDGGPHFGAKMQDILPIKLGQKLRVAEFKDAKFEQRGLVGFMTGAHEEFRAGLTTYDQRDGEIALPAKFIQTFELELGQTIFWAPAYYSRPAKEDV